MPFRFEHVVRNDNNTVQYAVLSDGATREVVLARWTAADDRVERLAVVVYPAGGDNSVTAAVRAAAIGNARRIAELLANGTPTDDAQTMLTADVDRIDAQVEAAARLDRKADAQTALRARAEEQQDGVVRRFGRRRPA